MATKPLHLREQAKRAYEIGRIKHAAALSIPTLLLGGMVALMSHEVTLPLLLASLLYLVSMFLLWWGRAPGRSVLPGVIYGLLPLSAGVIAELHGHVCMGSTCFGVCLPLCIGGGILAGLFIARVAARSESPLSVFFSAAATALFTGAIGNSCVGFHGIIGMGAGIALGLVPMKVLRHLRHG